VLVFMVASTAILVRVLRESMIPGGFNQDTYAAASLARRYLQSPPGIEVVDMYTQGFLHPLLYVPLLAFLRAVGITPPLQDGLAIAFVQAVAVGLIALLAYIGSRCLLKRLPALAVAFLCIGPPLFLSPLYIADQLSPNGEILGSVLLLGIWAILVHRPAGIGAVSGLIGLSVAAFHLKYQLMPQVAALILGGGLGRLRTLRLLAISLVACLLVDLLVYRLGGSGIFSRAGSLLVDYMGIVDSGTLARAGSGFSLWGLAVGLANQMSAWFANAPDWLMWNLRAMSAQSPQFSLAWAVWLVPLLRRQYRGPRFRAYLIGALLLSLATIFAINLPNKRFDHYVLLLLPTAVVVMATGLAQFSALARSTGVPTRLVAPRTARPLASTCSAVLLALVPATALLFSTGLPLNRALMASGHQSQATLPHDTRQEGLHIYGWDYRLFGIQDTHSSDLNLDILLATSAFRRAPGDYIRALIGPHSRPRYVLDHVASPGKGGLLAIANFPPLAELARAHGINLLALYKVRQQNELGILYERISDAPTRPARRIGAELKRSHQDSLGGVNGRAPFTPAPSPPRAPR
jgi:hypothetical protein